MNTDIPNARRPAPHLLTGGQPTMAQLSALAAAGARTVVNLRAEAPALRAEEQAAVEAAGMRYVALPVAGAAGLTDDNADRLGALIQDTRLYPLVVHCASGNRVGALVAIDAARRGADTEAAIEKGRLYGLTSLEAVVRERLG